MLTKKEFIMKFGGLQKTTLLDYPGRLACTVFTNGCNFKCPFCHNSSLALGTAKPITEEKILSFLKKRRGILDGICITGGEPLIHDDIIDFIEAVHELGYSVKLDTNGSYPDRLQELIDRSLIDYVAMDIKNSPDKYALSCGADIEVSDIRKSIEILMQGKIPYEFRTTVVKELHTKEDIHQIGKRIAGAQKFYLQQFKDSPEVLQAGFSAYSKDEMKELIIIAKKYVPAAVLRGI